MRAGTENVYGIIGMAKALELMTDNLEPEAAHIKSLRDRMQKGLTEAVPGITFNGDIDGESLYTVLSVSFPPSVKNEMLLLALDIAGVSCSSGSACSSGAEVGSHVLQAIGHDPDRKSVRFSFSRYNTVEEIDFVLDEIKKTFPVESAVAG
jgi:cysteine desulfurase